MQTEPTASMMLWTQIIGILSHIQKQFKLVDFDLPDPFIEVSYNGCISATWSTDKDRLYIEWYEDKTSHACSFIGGDCTKLYNLTEVVEHLRRMYV